jgi:hypothetical protein
MSTMHRSAARRSPGQCRGMVGTPPALVSTDAGGLPGEVRIERHVEVFAGQVCGGVLFVGGGEGGWRERGKGARTRTETSTYWRINLMTNRPLRRRSLRLACMNRQIAP